MKNQHRSRAPGHAFHQFDASAITDTISRALAAAGLDTASGAMRGVTDTIRQSLSAAGLMQRDGTQQSPQQHFETIDGVAHEVPSPTAIIPRAVPSREGNEAPVAEPGNDAEYARPGQFLARSFTNAAGTRAYKLYVPAGYADQCSEPMPLLVMLHGCTQSPDDFAAGTRMNAWADVHGFLVVYPAQSANANGSKCWNWFRTEDQARDSGEPSLIAGITREVAAAYSVDARRIFVAGM
ncbi:MAG: PHB depolymerase family esterase, partial [Casimicrobiaceae bacterium]